MFCFKPYFDEQTSSKAQSRRLTILTLNKESRNAITEQMITLSGGKYMAFQDNTDLNVIETANNIEEVSTYIDKLRKRMGYSFFNLL